jgi:hypothetical protein
MSPQHNTDHRANTLAGTLAANKNKKVIEQKNETAVSAHDLDYQ